jgi:hypothetical protein
MKRSDKCEVTIYDPRLNEDYDPVNFQTKSKFSSIKHGLFVVECYVNIDWRIYHEIIANCIGRTSKEVFVTFNPWRGSESLTQTIIQKSIETVHSGRFICSYLPKTDSLFQILEHAYTKDPHGWGQLCLGGCNAKFTTPVKKNFFQNIDWDSAQLFTQAEKIGCLLCLDEMQHSLFLAKLLDSEVKNNCDDLATLLNSK